MARTTLRRVVSTLGTPDVSAETDCELLRRYAREEDEAAFALLVRRHARLVQGVCRRALSHTADAEDAAQAVFVLLAKKAKAGRWQASIANWLHATARKVSATARRSAARRATRERRAANREATSPIDQMTGRELLAVLDEELAALPASYREPLILCHLDDLSREDAAKRLGIAVGTVKIRLERGKKKLATALESRGVTLGVGLLALGTASASSNIDSILAAVGHPPAPVAALVHEVSAMTWFKPALVAMAVSLSLIGGILGVGSRPATAEDPPKPAMKADPVKAKPAEPKAVKTVSGVVVGPDGKPVAGATLELKTASASLVKDSAAKPAGMSDADGKFKVEVPAGVLHFWLIARKDGFGVAWLEPEYPTGAFPASAKLELVKDFPINGRVLDTEGKPVAGATVTVRDVIEPMNRDLDKVLKGSLNGGFGTVGQWEKVLFEPIKPATTDADGKFVISGLGADRIVGVAVHGKGIARMSGFAFTRAGVDVDAMNGKPRGPGRLVGDRPVMYPANPTFVVEAGYSLAGVVTNKGTGKPIPDCEVGVNAGFWDQVRVRTDAAGKYTLDGLTKGMQHHVHVTPPSGAGVFSTWKTVTRTDLDKPLALDFALAKGAIFKGKVIDKETKEPLRASFQILPTGDNEYVKQPEYETAARDMVWHGGTDDAFRITTVPGKSKVNISVVPMKTLYGQPFHPYRSGQSLDIDLPADGEKEHVIEIDRGKTATVEVVDAAGKPVTGLAVSGITYTNQDGVDQSRNFTLPAADSKFTVFGLNEKEKRQLIVLHPAKKLVGAMEIGPGVTEKLTLVPFQPVTGTFTDTDGKPLAGLTVSIDYEGYGEGPLVGEAGGYVLSAKTDKDGKFTIPTVVPGLPFRFGIQRGQTSYGGVPKIGQRVVKPGEPLDLGTRKLEILE